MGNPSKHEVSKQEIARRAHVRFCDRGCAHGGDVEDWFEAEREVIESRQGETASDEQAIAKPQPGPKSNRRR